MNVRCRLCAFCCVSWQYFGRLPHNFSTNTSALATIVHSVYNFIHLFKTSAGTVHPFITRVTSNHIVKHFQHLAKTEQFKPYPVCTKGKGHVFQSHWKWITHMEVTFTLWEFSMEKKNNMADETAVKFKPKLRHRVDSAKAFDSVASWSNCTLVSFW